MSYIALARKWRPKTFNELLGQSIVATTLMRSLLQQRLHHAYLFTGTRGVGKTSVARLFAKALNCEAGINAEPCLQCDSCIAIEQGSFIDLIEIDGASKTRVEDTRELLDNVIYAPSVGRFKIYLIDEVHMLSNHSFNALLKTLEEPPEHVKFLLATTDPQKLPPTVLSRCLQLHLKPIAAKIIQQHLANIVTKEQLTYENEALALLAKAAGGSMRDALSLLDQAILCSQQCIETSAVKSLLGMTQKDYALDLLQALSTGETQKFVTISQQIAEEGGAFRYVLEQILAHLHHINLRQIVPQHDQDTLPELTLLSKQWSPEEVQLFYQIGINAINDLPLAPSLAMGFEMTLLRMHAFQPMDVSTLPEAYDHNVSFDQPSATSLGAEIATPKARKQSAENSQLGDWPSIILQLNLTGLALSAIEQAGFIEKTPGTLVLCIDSAHQSLYTPTVKARIEAALTAYYHEPTGITLQKAEVPFVSPATEKKQNLQQNQLNANESITNDPFFQQMQKTFSGEIVKNSIEPLKNSL